MLSQFDSSPLDFTHAAAFEDSRRWCSGACT